MISFCQAAAALSYEYHARANATREKSISTKIEKLNAINVKANQLLSALLPATVIKGLKEGRTLYAEHFREVRLMIVKFILSVSAF